MRDSGWYNGSITQQSARIVLRVTGLVFDDRREKGGEFQIDGALIGDLLSFTIPGDTGYDNYTSVIFVDQLSPTESLGIAALAKGTVAGSEVRAAMSGDYEVLDKCDGGRHPGSRLSREGP